MITVFTPVYNRKYLMKRLYDSLVKQSCHDFEWLIIDDGSTDGLEVLVDQWKKQDLYFPVAYYHMENGGKHRAINFGAKVAKGDIFFIVDSDDFLAEDAVQFIKDEFKKIADNDSFAGISGLMSIGADGEILGGEPLFQDYVDATNFERGQYGLLKDKPCIYKTKIWKSYPLPEYEGENFLSEGVSHNEIAGQGLKIRWYNKVLLYVEYREDGLSKNIFEKRRDNPRGWAANILSNIKYIYQDDESIFKERYLFYECMNRKYTKQEICKILEMDDVEYRCLSEKWNEVLNDIDSILRKHQTSTLALYGMGMNAKRLALYLEELGIDIQYGIDRDYKQIHFQPTYSLDMKLPVVDSVCITMKNCALELKNAIQNKLSNSYVWALVEIDKIFT